MSSPRPLTMIVLIILSVVLVCSDVMIATEIDKDANHPISKAERDRLDKALDEQIAQYSLEIRESPSNTANYLRRGDAFFFRGRFRQAIEDYDKTIALDPNLSNRHWQRGIACYYAEKFDEAAKQFEAYHSFDNVDRENGIWRFLCQAKSQGVEYARAQLLQYHQDDRPPLSSVYRLFQGKATPRELLASIESAELSEDERAKQLFYVQLYVGLNYELEGANDLAIQHLRESTASSWGRNATYGPQYMWHVGRIQFEKLLNEQANK